MNQIPISVESRLSVMISFTGCSTVPLQRGTWPAGALCANGSIGLSRNVVDGSSAPSPVCRR